MIFLGMIPRFWNNPDYYCIQNNCSEYDDRSQLNLVKIVAKGEVDSEYSIFESNYVRISEYAGLVD